MHEIPPTGRGRTRKGKHGKRTRSAPPRSNPPPVKIVPSLDASLLKVGTHHFTIDEMEIYFVTYDYEGKPEKINRLRLNARFPHGEIEHGYYLYKIRRVVDMFGIPVTPTIWYIVKKSK